MSKEPVPGQQNIGPYGEELFERYLINRSLRYERHPYLLETRKVLDFAVYASDGTRILVEVKTIFKPPPVHSGVGYHDPYLPIRNHLGEAFRQFTDLPDTLNVIALAAFPGSFVDLSSPHIMLGAMYGDTSFQIPFDTATGRGDSKAGTNVFVQGKGPMIGRFLQPRRTRISAVLSLHNPAPDWPGCPERGSLSLSDIARKAVAQLQNPKADMRLPYVTCWDNAAAASLVPGELFTGPMDQRWSVENGFQSRVFVGTERRHQEGRSCQTAGA